MAKNYTHPHWEIEVADFSAYTPIYRERLPLHVPLFFGKAQKGPVGVPVYCSSTDSFLDIFGQGTLDEHSPYYGRESLFASYALRHHGLFYVRLAEETAAASTIVLECTIKKVDVPQFERDAFGEFVLDPTTKEKIPLIDSGNSTQITEPGISYKWSLRQLLATESVDNLKPVTYGSGATQYIVYPVFAGRMTSAGSFGDDFGVKFFCDINNLDKDLADNLKAVPYTFGAVAKTYGQDTVSPVRNFWQLNFSDFVARENAMDKRTEKRYSFDKILGTDYTNNVTRQKIIPMTSHFYSTSIEEIGKQIIALDGTELSITDPFMVNVMGGTTVDGRPLPHVIPSADPDHITLNRDRILYFTGGNDGDIDDMTIEDLIRQFFLDVTYPEILNQAKYPFTHIYDVGYEIDTKKSLVQFLGKHDAFKLVLSTYSTELGRMSTEAEDFSVGSSLYGRALLQPESALAGTGCCRVEIYMQCGRLAAGSWDQVVPATLAVLEKKASCFATQTIGQLPKGLPGSIVSIFKENNWTPTDPDRKQLSWDTGLNYFQHYDMEGIHYPDYHTVYTNNSSVLSSAFFTDMIVFSKHIARYNWSRFTGVEDSRAQWIPLATNALNSDLSKMTGGYYGTKATYVQSAEQRRIGFESDVVIDFVGRAAHRISKYKFNCTREGYTIGE